MKRARSMLVALLVLAVTTAAASMAVAQNKDSASAGAVVKIVADHENGVYKSGEPVRFLVTATANGKPLSGSVACVITLNGAKEVLKSDLPLKNGQAVVTYMLKEPGCLMATASLPGGGKDATAAIGAAVDPFKIQLSLPAPSDFDKFWDEQKRKLAAVPMNPKLTAVPEERKVNYGPEVECFDMQLDCLGGKPASGYFCRPKGAKPKSLPAVLSLHSAGIRGGSLQAAWQGAKQNKLAVDLNAHGLPNGKPQDFYNNLRDGELLGYAAKGLDSPETFYFLGMYLRIVRAIDFLTSQPEWDGKTLIVVGSSQGGGQSLVAAGIDPRVTELSAIVPAFCDETAFAIGRKSGWPGTRAANPAQQKTLQYFDACNFAARTKAKATVTVGLIDTTCTPVGVFAAFNQLKGDKTIIILPFRGHGGTREDAALSKDPKYQHSEKAAKQ